jgi:CheY-like chemotaxis protein
VLVVEDDGELRELYSRFLRGAGYEVLEAGDGVAALQIAPAHTPSVILMDLGLPVIDGWEATRILKRDPRTSAIPVIAITGQSLKTREQDARSAGCDAVLRKPCDGDVLVAAVKRFAPV